MLVIIQTMRESSWYVYIVQCGDLSLYTGVTTDLQRRIGEHNSGNKAARYTRTRRPVGLVYFEYSESRAAASSREHCLKQLTAEQKRQLIENSYSQCQRQLAQIYSGNNNQVLMRVLER